MIPDPATAPTTRNWHTLAAGDAARLLGSTPSGLSSEEAARRLEEYGPNQLEREKETSWWMLMLHQFTDPLIYILLIAALLTLLLRDYSDAGVILAALILNAIIGFTQERRAQQAMRALQQLSAPHCQVVRDAGVRDVVVLASGSRVPADLRLFRVQDLQIDESALTGESLPVAKSVEALEGDTRVAGDQHNMAFSGNGGDPGPGLGVRGSYRKNHGTRPYRRRDP